MKNPAVTVIVISDFACGTEQGWRDLRITLASLARQDYDESFEPILLETEVLRRDIPADLVAIVPGLRTVIVPPGNSYELKNRAVEMAATEFVVIIDGDCAPDPDWLRHMIAALRADPRSAAVSGRTVYEGDRLANRVLALIERSYIEGPPGETWHIANNAVGFRRLAYLAHPLPVDAGVFAAELQAEGMRQAGWRLLFQPQMRVTHAWAGWAFERDLRQYMGYGFVKVRQRDPRIRYSWLLRLGILTAPAIVAGRLLTGWRHILRWRKRFRVRWFEVPVAFVFAGAGVCLEIPGILRALRGEGPPKTRYR